ncbi:glycosyltransferase family 39 protein [Microbacterium sp. ASV49]|uniref:Glycosyltransferase family 39 protein n=1 Tax=Microbacterium candidum TaxID=3041922 RepID=A0ABT7MV66_9MICO|nr:glycosyltransferase family 39 protein [Microbacterium sp. ASV49]MDL9978313.1 glycosyltransferase family 39 protein [Microbacterium sp. ASV49]
MSLTTSTPTVVADPHPARGRVLVAMLLGFVGTGVAAAGSWIPSLWADEVTSIMSAQRSIPSLMQMLGQVDAVHGLYYAGLHAWGSVFGFSPFSVRIPSAVAVGFATAAVVLLADRLGSRRVAVLAGVVCALLPRVTYMGEEARSFAFSAAIVAWLTFLLIVALGREGRAVAIWVLYGALLAVGIFVFLYVALFAVVHAIVVFTARVSRRIIARWAIATGSGLLAAAPVLVYAFREHGQVAYLGTIEQLAPDTLFSGLWFGQWTFAVIAWGTIVVAVIVEVGRMRTRRASRMPVLLDESGAPSLVFVGLVWLLVPTLVLISMHAFVPDFTARYVSFCAPAAALLVASGVDDLFAVRRWIGSAAGALVILLALPVYAAQRTPYAKNDADYAEISAVLGAHAKTGDAVVFDESTRPSRRPRLAKYGYPAGFDDLEDVTLQTSYLDGLTLRDYAFTVQSAAILGRFDGVDRVWMIEYAPSPGHADTYGVRDLEAIGYHATSTRIPTHRGLITLYERAP